MTDGGLATPSRKVVVSNKAVAKLFPPTDRNSTGTFVAVPAEASVSTKKGESKKYQSYTEYRGQLLRPLRLGSVGSFHHL
jgi:hypothetical protein